MDIHALNKAAWDRAVGEGTNPYTKVVSAEQVAEALEQRIRNKEMFHFSHTMEAQLGGLIRAGFVITGFYEDRRSEEDGNPIRHFMPSVFVARAQKMEFSRRT